MVMCCFVFFCFLPCVSGCVLVNCCVYNKSKINNNKNKRGEKNFQDKFKEGRAFSTEGTGRPLFFFSYFPLFLSVVSINSDLNVSSLFCRAMGNRNKQFFSFQKMRHETWGWGGGYTRWQISDTHEWQWSFTFNPIWIIRSKTKWKQNDINN